MNHLKILTLVSLFINLGVAAKGQDVRFDPLYAVVDEMAVTNTYDATYSVGYAGSPSKQYARYKQFLSMANDRQLIDLAANHKNAVVRIYALKALTYRKSTIPTELLLKFRSDMEKVTQLHGCLATEVTVSSLVFFETKENKPAEIKQ